MVDLQSDVDEIVSAIRGADRRATVAKRTVAEVQKRQPDVSPSTVYRILEEFETLQIVVHAHLDQHAAVYHLAGAVHGHLTCDQCGSTVEIPAAHFDLLSKDLQKTFGFLLDRHHVAVTGTCAYCQDQRRLLQKGIG
jgi:Fe2+ or Zn2+ uptake regulation protein